MTPTPSPTPDCVELAAYGWEITFEPYPIVPGDIVTISVPIHNVGHMEALSLLVNFGYELTPLDPEDDPNIGFIGATVLESIAVGDFKMAQWQWDTTGLENLTYPVYVYVTDVVPEECEPGSVFVQTDLIVPVELYSFDALGGDGTVRVEWTTTTEINNLGFNLYQSSVFGGGFEKVNQTLIPGAGTSYQFKQYSYEITGLTNGEPRFYYLETVDYWGGLKRSDVIIGVPHKSPLSVRLNTMSDREQYVIDDPMVIRGRLRSSGAAGNVRIQVMLLIGWSYLGDIISPVDCHIPSILDMDFDLMHHVWNGQEPAGEYRIATVLTDAVTGELIHIDLNTFRFVSAQ